MMNSPRAQIKVNINLLGSLKYLDILIEAKLLFMQTPVKVAGYLFSGNMGYKYLS